MTPQWGWPPGLSRSGVPGATADGEVERRFTKDELLTTITIYWVTQTINSSTRLYYENQHNPWLLQPGQRIDVPCAVARFPHEISQPPREWAERFYPQAVDGDAPGRPLCGV